jgi:hypothetical protein
MIEWLAEYRLSADEEESCGEDGEAFSKDDFGIQSDLIEKKDIFSMQNKKFKNIHPAVNCRLVEEFDPQSDKVDKFILEKIVGKPKNRSPKSNENNPLPKTTLEPHKKTENDDSPETSRYSSYSLNRQSRRSNMILDNNQDTGDDDRPLI